MTERFMEQAIDLALDAAAEMEVPVGAVVVYENRVVGRGRNHRETRQNALSHAEIEAINEACANVGSWRLCDCDLYVTLEPCPMCAGAAINARIRRIYFGAYDPKSGAVGSVLNLYAHRFNHLPQVTGGVLGVRCGAILTGFFRNLREQVGRK